MLIHQITDLHVPDDDDGKNQHVKANITALMSYIADAAPDLLVITGDLSMTDGSVQACQWLQQS